MRTMTLAKYPVNFKSSNAKMTNSQCVPTISVTQNYDKSFCYTIILMKLYRVVTRHYIIVPRSIIVRYPETFRRKVGREATRRASIVKKTVPMPGIEP